MNPIDYPWGLNPKGVDIKDLNHDLPSTNVAFQPFMETYNIGKAEQGKFLTDLQKRLRILMSQEQFRENNTEEKIAEKLAVESVQSSAMQVDGSVRA